MLVRDSCACLYDILLVRLILSALRPNRLATIWSPAFGKGCRSRLASDETNLIKQRNHEIVPGDNIYTDIDSMCLQRSLDNDARVYSSEIGRG